MKLTKPVCRLEAKLGGSRSRRTLVFGEGEPGRAKMRELLATGIAHHDGLFIFTGVPQSDPGAYVKASR